MTDFTAASALSAQVFASSFASSGVTSAPTLPVTASLPSTIGSWPEVYTYPGPHGRLVRGQRRHDGGQGQAELGEARLDSARHYAFSRFR